MRGTNNKLGALILAVLPITETVAMVVALAIHAEAPSHMVTADYPGRGAVSLSPNFDFPVASTSTSMLLT